MSVPSKPTFQFGSIRPVASVSTLQFFWGPPESGPVTNYILECPAISYSNVLSPTVFTYTLNGLSDGTDLTFTISASNENGVGPAATYRTVQPGPRISVPPESMLVSQNSDTTNTVTWSQNNSNVKRYVITPLSSDSNDTYTSYSNTPPSAAYGRYGKRSQTNYNSNVTFTGLTASNSYGFKVQAVNDSGYSPAVTIGSYNKSGLLLHLQPWNYNSNTNTWNDSTSNSNNFSGSNTLSLNSTGNGVIFNNNLLSNVSMTQLFSTFTFSTWAKCTSGTLFESFGNTYNNFSFKNAQTLPGTQPNVFQGIVKTGGGLFIAGDYNQSQSVLNVSTFNNLTVTYDGSTFISYLNGTMNGSNLINETLVTEGIGWLIGRGSDGLKPFIGEIGEIMMFDHAKALSEVVNIYNLHLGNYYRPGLITKYFYYTGSLQTFKVPSNVSTINFWAWGAGGSGSDGAITATGGAGAFAKGSFSVNTGDILTILIGQGGMPPGFTGYSIYGGGGLGGSSFEGIGGGSGGGRSVIYYNNVNLAGEYVDIAGGGGGGNSALTAAGAGGSVGSNGQDGDINTGATTSSGGISTDNGFDVLITLGNNGSQLQGGNGGYHYSGGGGGGYYGGAGGSYRGTYQTGYFGTSGGGGSSYANSNVTVTTTESGNHRVPGGLTDPMYVPGIAVGGDWRSGDYYMGGGPGLVILQYTGFP
jgi:hypothetical protein